MNYAVRLGAVSAIAVFMGAVGASASTLTINSVTGAWSEATPSNITIDNTGPTVTARWGDPVNVEQSGYDFTGTYPPAGQVNEGVGFALGDFTHHNFPIQSPWLRSIDLDVAIDVDGYASPINSNFTFTHVETPNNAGTCPSGSISTCDDIVSVALNLGGSDTFDIDGTEYVFTITGFAQDGVGFSSFLTEENKVNTANLMGSFVTVSQVPLPATLPLLMAGLGGLAFLRRRKS